MPNLYGVSNPVILPSYTGNIGAVDIACTAGSETNIIDSGLLSALSSGYYYPIAWVSLFVSAGATPPSQININARIGAGADYVSLNTWPTYITANQTIQFYGTLCGVGSQTAWQPPGSHLFISVTPFAQNVTVRASGSTALFALFRAPDQ